MPWTSRLLSTPSSSSSNATHSNQATPLSNAESSASIAIDYAVPVLQPLHISPGPPAQRRAHARSISHPFPSILSSSARRSEKKATKQDYLDSDDDDEVTYIPEPRSSSPRKRWTPAEHFVSGKCMTCNSTVRWPRERKIFRCTVCLTVNDLEPCSDPRDHLPGHGHPPPPPKDESSKTTLPGTSLWGASFS
jgi:E3 ubiquitin-protein ligase HECTD2